MPEETNDEVIDKILAEFEKPSEVSHPPKDKPKINPETKKPYDEYYEAKDYDKDEDIPEEAFFD